jgi:uncharacterized membrane protein
MPHLHRGEASSAAGFTRLLFPLLALTGLIISLYLAYQHYQGLPPYCAELSGCEVVAASPYSQAAGVPVAVFGAVIYISLLGLGLLWHRSGVDWALLGLYGLSLAGVFYSGYLTYVEVFVLNAICLWCVASAVVITGIFILSVAELRRIGAL